MSEVRLFSEDERITFAMKQIEEVRFTHSTDEAEFYGISKILANLSHHRLGVVALDLQEALHVGRDCGMTEQAYASLSSAFTCIKSILIERVSERIVVLDEEAPGGPPEPIPTNRVTPSLPIHACFIVAWFTEDQDEKESKIGDLRERFDRDIGLVGLTYARLLAYRFSYHVASPAFGEWLRRKVVQRLLGSAVTWLNQKIN